MCLIVACFATQIPGVLGQANIQRHNEFIYAIICNAHTAEPPKKVPVRLSIPTSTVVLLLQATTGTESFTFLARPLGLHEAVAVKALNDEPSP